MRKMQPCMSRDKHQWKQSTSLQYALMLRKNSIYHYVLYKNWKLYEILNKEQFIVGSDNLSCESFYWQWAYMDINMQVHSNCEKSLQSYDAG